MLPFVRMLEYGNTIPVLDVKKIEPYHNTGFIALDKNGKLYAKGNQPNGQFGTGNTTALTKTTLIATDVSNFWAGQMTVIILKNDGTFWVSGGSVSYYGLSITNTTVFVECTAQMEPGFSGAQEIYMCGSGNLILSFKTTGELYCLGWDSQGHSGIKTGVFNTWTKNTSALINNIKTIQIGIQQVFALKNDGTLIGWGVNSNYVISDQVSDSRFTTPIIVPNGGGLTYDFHLMPSGALFVTDNGLWGRGYLSVLSQGGTFTSSTNIGIKTTLPFTMSTAIRFVKDLSTIFSSTNQKVFMISTDDKIYASGLEYNKCFGINSPGSSGNIPLLTEVVNTYDGGVSTMYMTAQDNTLFVKGNDIFIAGNIGKYTGISTDNMVPIFTKTTLTL